MRVWRIAAASALALGAAGCNRSGAPSADNAMELSCAVFADATAVSLAERYGAENVVQQTVPGPEGSEYEATVLFPDEPMRRAEVTWRDGEGRAQISDITISGERSDWVGPHGVHIGQSLDDVASNNGGGFTLYGFAWDYGGWVSNWNGGAFAPVEGCVTHVRFQPSAGDYAGGADGATLFASDSEGVLSAEARVAEFGLGFSGDEAAQ